MGRFLVSAAFVASAAGQVDFDAPSSSDLVNDHEYVARLNAEEGSLWVAAPQKHFEGWTMDDARKLLGTHLSHIDHHLNETLPDSVYEAYERANGPLPADFDSRTKWPDLIHPIRDQQQCGSCWAFSASEVLSDRESIATGSQTPVLSAEDMVSCDRGDSGCNGGYLSRAWTYLTSTGLVTDTCFPYTAGMGRPAKCAQQCVDSESFTRTKASSSYAIKGPIHMAREIMQHGPIQVGFVVYRSFMSYSSGIYHKKGDEKQMGGHAVKIVGFGTQGVKYWTVANSWNTDWGEDGFFRIRRGHNECGIEKMGPPYAGLAATAAAAEDLIVV